MERLTDKAHQIILSHVRPGDVAIDATAGNGHDTLFLAQAVGPEGVVLALDSQTLAVENTARRLQEAGQTNVRLRQASHAELTREIPPEHHGQVAAVMFNLGYLPGSDKSHTTKPETTRSAIEGALPLLREGGVLTVVAYTGHPGGLEEMRLVEQLLQSLSAKKFTVETFCPVRPEAPRLFVVVRWKKTPGAEISP